jgi:hypothetical protein
MKNKNKNDILVADVNIKNKYKNKTLYRTVKIDELEIFYRETGQKNDNKPNVLPVHGFRLSSHMYRNQITLVGLPDWMQSLIK